MERWIEIVEAGVGELIGLAASVEARTRRDDRKDPVYFVVRHDPGGNEFCIGWRNPPSARAADCGGQIWLLCVPGAWSASASVRAVCR